MRLLLEKIRKILHDRKAKQMLTRIVSTFAAVVVFITTYALVLPAITMESQADCGIPAHQHDDSCYEEVLVCGLEESEEHQHDASCYEKQLVCCMEAHTHSAACYSQASGGGDVGADGGGGSSAEDYAVVAATTEPANGSASGAGNTDAKTSGSDFNVDGSTDAIDGDVTDATVDAGAGLSSPSASEDAYVPELESLLFDQLLTNKTGIYYFHPEEGKTIPENTADITEWTRVKDDTDLAPADMLRVYLRYTIPAGALNSTNPVARYRLPANLHLTDQQIEEINTTVNGIANQYINLDTLEILDPDQYNQYLGIEAVEGTRTPSDDINEYFAKHSDMNGQEYISATVSAENVYDTEGLYGDKDAYLGQDLIFTFTPYTVQKNQNEYDADGQPTKAGEKINGWLCVDVKMDQIDWGEPAVTTTDNLEQRESDAQILFAAEDKTLKIDEISTALHMIGQTETASEEDANNPDQTSTDGKSGEDIADGADETNGADDAVASTDPAIEINAETYPAVSFEDSIVVRAGTLSTDNESAVKDTPEETTIAVSVSAEPETFPLGTTMVLGAVDDMDTVASAVEGAVEGQTRGFHAVDISFIDPDGKEIEPLKPIKVSMTSEAIKQAVEDSSTVPVVMHVENPADPVATDPAADDSAETDVASHTADQETDNIDPASAAQTGNDTVADETSAGREEVPLQTDTTTSAPTATIVETSETSSTDKAAEKKETSDTLSFDAGSFSVYAIVYTVDFHYEVNGKTYEFSIPGGGFVSLEHLVEVLGIASAEERTDNEIENTENDVEYEDDFAGDVSGVGVSGENREGSADEPDDNAASLPSDSMAYEDTIKSHEVKGSEAAKKFVADVESVEFSSPELVWIGKVDEETTVRELKESKELEVKYSGELTVKDISKINAQTVEAGDWVLISVQPFENEQTLTVVMKDGEIFTIQVAGQVLSDDVRVQYSSADGDTVVTACASVGTLPEGTKIQIREINPYTDFSEDIEEEAELYAEAREAVANKLWEEHRTLGESKVVDITFIDSNGKEIEPEGDVDVSLMLAEALKADDGENPSLAHISGGEKTETEFLEAEIEGKEAVFTSDAFSIYVIFNDGAYTGTLQPVNFDTGWISFGGDMQARNDLPNGAYNRALNIYPSPEGAWKWLTVNLYELKEGVSEDNYLNSDSYNLLDSYSYIAGNTDIVVEDYNFGAREVLCTAFRGSGSADWRLYDAKNGDETKVNYGGKPLQYRWNDIIPYWVGYWDQEANVLNIHLTREKEVVREHTTDYVIRYYHADGTYDTVTGSLTAANPSLSLPADYKIIDGREVFSGLSIGAGHSALSANTNTGSMAINFDENVSLVKANVYYKENIEIKNGGPVSGQPLYDTKTENGRKIYDTSRTGLHTDKTATPVTDSANAGLNDGRTFNLTLESWNVGANYANVGMILDASGSMVWPSDLPEEVKVPKNTLSSYGSKTTKNIKTGGGSSTTSITGYFLTEAQVNSILNTNYVDNSKLGYNGYRYYLKDPAANVNEYVPLGYYDGVNSNGVNFSPNGNGTRGWYYVTSADVVHYQTDGTGKQYCKFPNNNDAWQDAGSTATQFWLDDEGVLHGYWYRSSGRNYYWNSKVYVSPANADNKSEVLQYGLGRFAATLLANSPTSQISMVRFSRARKNNYFTAGELALLNWTTDTKLVTAAMNQQYGNDTSTGFDTQNGLKVYNYGFTGDTSTGSGIDAYINDLTEKAAGNYVATSGNANNSKYLIIFTDGKDTDPATSNDNYRFNRATSRSEATNLKNQGYTIFTVMMQSAGMSSSDVDDAESFLRSLAGTKTENGNATNSDGSDKYYFNFMYDDPAALVEAFQKIAKEIAKPLDGYMVRDYIDPRFDLLDADGNVLTRLNRNGVWMPRFITTADGKTALLKYDTEKEMFYIEIENQSIPTSPQNATDVTVNTVQLTVRAKDDFIGGNDILSNGNEAGQNQVFKPVDNYTIEVNEPVAANPDTTKYPKKDYPKTTTNPATYGTTVLNYEDTIFLDETISPIGLFGQVSTMDDETANDNHLSVYAGYLSRAGKKLHDDENYYINILQNGALPSGHQNVNGEVITITDKIVTIKLPYYYLKDENNIRSYAGGDLHQGDKVGTITYTWKAVDTGGHTLKDNNAFKDFTSTTLDTVKYQLSMSYTPDPYVSNDSIANNGSARTLALTNQTGTDKLIRDPVGNAAVSQSTDAADEGVAVIHVVAGKIGVTKKISKQDLDDQGITVSDLPTVTFAITKDGAAYKTVTANMTQSTLKDGYYELTVWETDLPKGTYSVSEEAGDGYKLASVEALAIQDDSATANVNESEFAAKYSADSDAKTVTWYIGPKGEAAERQPDVSTYPDCVNGTVLFPYDLVTDTLYHVDPDLAVDNGKHYLNGQIGQAVYINKLNPFVMLRKADMANSSKPLDGAVFSFYKEVPAGTTGALTELIPEKNVVLVSSVTSGDYEQENGTDAGKKLAGYVSLGRLDTDGTYYLVEDTVPTGYVSPEWKYVKIVFTDSQIGWTAYKEDGSIYGGPQSAAKAIVDGKNCYTVTILNNPGAALPNTGGPGTTLIYLLGLLLATIAGAGLMMKNRRKNAA